MPITANEAEVLRRYGSPCGQRICATHQSLLVYWNVLLDRPPTNRLTLDDPDVRRMLGYRDDHDPDPDSK